MKPQSVEVNQAVPGIILAQSSLNATDEMCVPEWFGDKGCCPSLHRALTLAFFRISGDEN